MSQISSDKWLWLSVDLSKNILRIGHMGTEVWILLQSDNQRFSKISYNPTYPTNVFHNSPISLELFHNSSASLSWNLYVFRVSISRYFWKEMKNAWNFSSKRASSHVAPKSRVVLPWKCLKPYDHTAILTKCSKTHDSNDHGFSQV